MHAKHGLVAQTCLCVCVCVCVCVCTTGSPPDESKNGPTTVGNWTLLQERYLSICTYAC